MNLLTLIPDFISFFTNKLRISNPWKYKVPLLISFPYIFLAQGVITTEQANIGFLAALFTIIGFAGIGYLTNDWSDRKKDQLAGKQNATMNWKPWLFVVVLGLFLAIALLPWLYLPLDRISLILIGIELILFFFYAFKPFRLKERGLLGVITDALYAHTVPAILASYTFHLFTGKTYVFFFEFIVMLSIWQFLSGIRNILYHQIVDFENDKSSATNTFATWLGLEKTLIIKKFIVLPLEGLAFGTFLWLLSNSFPLVWVIVGVGLFMSGYYFFQSYRNTTIPLYKRVTNFFLDDLYINYVPLIPLVAMIFVKTEVTLIFAIHLIVFRNIFKQPLGVFVRWVQGSKLFHWVFGFESYVKGLLLHVFIMALYITGFALMYSFVHGMADDEGWFFWIQKKLGRILVGVILMHGALIVLARKEQVANSIKGFFVELGSPYNLALFRIIIFTVITGAFFSEVFGPFKAWTYLDDSHRVGLPLIQWLTDILPITPEFYHVMSIIGVVLAFQILLGFKTRWALILYVPVALYLWGVPNFFGKLNHRHIIVWVPMILMFSRCADVWSIDALIDRYIRKKPKPSASVEYALPLKFVWITLAIIYCCSGFHKIWDAGLHWVFSDNLRNQIMLEWVEQYDQVTSFRIDKYPFLLNVGAVGVVMMEILFPLLILKPVLRPFATLSAWGLHLTAGYFLMIDFIQLRIVSLSFINWNRVQAWSQKIFAKSSIQEVRYDWNYDFTKFKKMPLMYVAVPLVSMNLLFGIIQINSWPFSSYPAYSNVVEDEVTLLKMIPQTSSGEIIDLMKLGKEQEFRWENMRPFEERIMEKYLSTDTTGLNDQLIRYWDLWSTKVEGLESVQQVEISYETTSIVPEKRKFVLDQGYLGTIKIKKGER